MKYVESRTVNGQLVEFDAIRLTANYLVVLIHAWAACQYCAIDLECRTWFFLCNVVTSVAMPTLFLLSGFLMMRNLSVETYESKIARRLKRLALPYLAWNFSLLIELTLLILKL